MWLKLAQLDTLPPKYRWVFDAALVKVDSVSLDFFCYQDKLIALTEGVVIRSWERFRGSGWGQEPLLPSMPSTWATVAPTWALGRGSVSGSVGHGVGFELLVWDCVRVRSAERKTEIAVGRLVDRPDAVELRLNGTRWRPEVSVLCWETAQGSNVFVKDPRKFSSGQLFLTKMVTTFFSLY